MEQSPEEVSVVVSEMASDTLETRIEELPPLINVINPDALNEIVSDNPLDDITVMFTYAGLRVSVHSGNTVYIKPNNNASVSRR